MNSIGDDLSTEIVEAIQSVGLLWRGNTIATDARKLLMIEEGVDTVPMVQVVVPREPDTTKPFDTGGKTGVGRRLEEYGYHVALVTPGNREPKQYLDVIREYRQRLADRFGTARPLETDGFLKLAIVHDPTIDRAALANNYDITAMTLRVQVVRAIS